jgi:hypothetical protein
MVSPVSFAFPHGCFVFGLHLHPRTRARKSAQRSAGAY